MNAVPSSVAPGESDLKNAALKNAAPGGGALDLDLAARLLGTTAADLAPMPSRGVAHDHFRVIGRGLVLRVPRSQALQGLTPESALTRQAAAFARAAASGCTPRLVDAIEPRTGLPNGALLVTEIVGRPPRLPDDMPATARALAALHVLPTPPESERAPLETSADPPARLSAFVAGRLPLLENAGLPDDLLSRLRDRLAETTAQARALPPVSTLTGVDVHPGNFLIASDGRAVLTDLERAQYGHPAADLAHATLPTSTRWDPGIRRNPGIANPGITAGAVLSREETAAFYAVWSQSVGPDLADACRPAFTVMRRLVWLRTLTWMAHWRTGGRAAAPAMPADLLAHMDAHAAWALSYDGAAAAEESCRALEQGRERE